MIFVVASSVSSILFLRISMLKNKFKKTFSMFGVTMLSNVHFDLNEFDENQPNQGVTMLSNVHFDLFICPPLNNFDLNEFYENQPNQGVTMLSNVRAYFCCRRTISFYIALRCERAIERRKRKKKERKTELLVKERNGKDEGKT